MSSSDNYSDKSADIQRFLSKFQPDFRLSTERLEAVQQIGLALYGLNRFAQVLTSYRNELLGHALDPHSFSNTIIGLDEVGATLVGQVSGEAIAGWDFSATFLVASETINDTADKALSNSSGSQLVFDPEFVERAAYLLNEMRLDSQQVLEVMALLTVDRLDLLLTLTRTEASRLVEQLHRLNTASNSSDFTH